ncbi:MAG: hypothetical protein ABII00_14810, partial [Elusimicrobiota bacterium]
MPFVLMVALGLLGRVVAFDLGPAMTLLAGVWLVGEGLLGLPLLTIPVCALWVSHRSQSRESSPQIVWRLSKRYAPVLVGFVVQFPFLARKAPMFMACAVLGVL